MGLLKRLWGKLQSTRVGSSASWTLSESGNPTMVEGPLRITVFYQDNGWKYCLAEITDEDEPYFSEAYQDQEAAQEEALAHARGTPSRHQPLAAHFAERRRIRWEELIQERSLTIEALQRFLEENHDLGITALRKPEAKIASHQKQLHWQIAEYLQAGVSPNLISLAEGQKSQLARLAEEVATRIETKQTKQPPKSTPESDSQLSTELSRNVDDLIRLIADTPIVDPSEVEKRYRRVRRDATAKMLEGGTTYRQASRAPEFLSQKEESFQACMKEAGQDLAWQCSTVSDAFQRYLEIGETPAPHYPMRVAVLLSKAKDLDREKKFLAAWCMHFPYGNGAKYAALVERAKKVGAISTKQI